MAEKKPIYYVKITCKCDMVIFFWMVKLAPVPEVCLFENGKERKRYPNLLDTTLIAET